MEHLLPNSRVPFQPHQTLPGDPVQQKDEVAVTRTLNLAMDQLIKV